MSGHMSGHMSSHMSGHMFGHMSDHVCSRLVTYLVTCLVTCLVTYLVMSVHVWSHVWWSHVWSHVWSCLFTSGHMSGHISGHMSGHVSGHMFSHVTVLSLQGTCTEQVGQDTISRIWTAIITLDVNTIREYIDTSFIQVVRAWGQNWCAGYTPVTFPLRFHIYTSHTSSRYQTWEPGMVWY